MHQTSDEQTAYLRSTIHTHVFLHRLVRKIEHLLKTVFHAEDLDWRHVRSAAEEILIADILTRHHGNIDGVYFALRKSETEGHAWEQAIADYAAYAHNYFTTPLGVVLRRNIFGENSHFVTPMAGRYGTARETATEDPRTLTRILYEVTAKIIDPDVTDAWAAWILDEHIGDVVRAGALRGRLVRIDDTESTFAVQYEFESRDDLNRYLADRAPGLRDQGARRFGGHRVEYTRRTGEIADPKADSAESPDLQ